MHSFCLGKHFFGDDGLTCESEGNFCLSDTKRKVFQHLKTRVGNSSYAILRQICHLAPFLKTRQYINSTHMRAQRQGAEC